jgi:hypothetical protein
MNEMLSPGRALIGSLENIAWWRTPKMEDISATALQNKDDATNLRAKASTISSIVP